MDAAHAHEILREAYGQRMRVACTNGVLGPITDATLDAAFVDNGLPDMTGHELALAMRARLSARVPPSSPRCGAPGSRRYDGSLAAGSDTASSSRSSRRGY